MSLESCHRNKRVSCQFCNQSIPRRTKSFKTVIRLTLACALLLYCVNGCLIDISYFHSIPIFIGKLLFWICFFHPSNSFISKNILYPGIDSRNTVLPITIFDSTNDFKLHYFKMIGKIRYESEFLTLIEDLVKLIIKSAIISFLSEYLPKVSTFVCSWSVSWYSDPQYLNVESQNTIF